MAGVLFDQGKSVFVTIYSLNILGSFLSDASQELETAAESQHDIAVSAKDAVGQLDKSTEGSELFIGLCLGAGFALVLALICCVLVKFLRSFYFLFTLYSASACDSNFSVFSSGLGEVYSGSILDFPVDSSIQYICFCLSPKVFLKPFKLM